MHLMFPLAIGLLAATANAGLLLEHQHPLVLDVPSTSTSDGTFNATQIVQNNAPWALARVAQPGPIGKVPPGLGAIITDPSDPSAKIEKRLTTRDWGFPYEDKWGQGVVVYVIDSGVLDTHSELHGRVLAGSVVKAYKGKATEDACDHGTGVASLIAGLTVGIARAAQIYPIRVADIHDINTCYPNALTEAYVAEGVMLALDDIRNRKPTAAIINISWQWMGTKVVDALKLATAAGVHVVLAAGNDKGADQCKENSIDFNQITVGASDAKDQLAALSNDGQCITLFAPGVSMNVAASTGVNNYRGAGTVNSGCSYAAPLAAGVVASLISAEGNKPPKDMRARVLALAAHGVGIHGRVGTPDILLQSLAKSPKAQ
ncbi:Subtilisin-like protein [Mycena kentingensis (nom. inval.)]|nr:Subtilisin-like protein [Mycena kentingensis (nom. inval.)]